MGNKQLKTKNMTREAFIRKWCCTGYGYTEEKRDEMRDDLDSVIDWANSSINNNPLGIANVSVTVCQSPQHQAMLIGLVDRCQDCGVVE